MLIKYAATEMGFLDDYFDADPNHKSIRGNGITTYFFHVSQCILFCIKILLKQYLLPIPHLRHFIQGWVSRLLKIL